MDPQISIGDVPLYTYGTAPPFYTRFLSFRKKKLNLRIWWAFLVIASVILASTLAVVGYKHFFMTANTPEETDAQKLITDSAKDLKLFQSQVDDFESTKIDENQISGVSEDTGILKTGSLQDSDDLESERALSFFTELSSIDQKKQLKHFDQDNFEVPVEENQGSAFTYFKKDIQPKLSLKADHQLREFEKEVDGLPLEDTFRLLLPSKPNFERKAGSEFWGPQPRDFNSNKRTNMEDTLSDYRGSKDLNHDVEIQFKENEKEDIVNEKQSNDNNASKTKRLTYTNIERIDRQLPNMEIINDKLKIAVADENQQVPVSLSIRPSRNSHFRTIFSKDSLQTQSQKETRLITKIYHPVLGFQGPLSTMNVNQHLGSLRNHPQAKSFSNFQYGLKTVPEDPPQGSSRVNIDDNSGIKQEEFSDKEQRSFSPELRKDTPGLSYIFTADTYRELYKPDQRNEDKQTGLKIPNHKNNDKIKQNQKDDLALSSPNYHDSYVIFATDDDVNLPKKDQETTIGRKRQAIAGGGRVSRPRFQRTRPANLQSHSLRSLPKLNDKMQLVRMKEVNEAKEKLNSILRSPRQTYSPSRATGFAIFNYFYPRLYQTGRIL